MKDYDLDERLDILVDGGMSLAEAKLQLEKVDLLVDEMKRGVATFSFRKKDGTIREAHGTLVVDASEYTFKGGQASPKVVPFWDCDKLAWRSFALATLC